MQGGCGYRLYGYKVEKSMTTPPDKPSGKLLTSSTFVISVLSGGCGFMCVHVYGRQRKYCNIHYNIYINTL